MLIYKLLKYYVQFQEEFDPKQRRQQQHQRMAYEEDDRGYEQGPRIEQCSSS